MFVMLWRLSPFFWVILTSSLLYLPSCSPPIVVRLFLYCSSFVVQYFTEQQLDKSLHQCDCKGKYFFSICQGFPYCNIALHSFFPHQHTNNEPVQPSLHGLIHICPFSIHLSFPPTSVRFPLWFRVLALQKATSVPHQSEKDYQSLSAVVSHRHLLFCRVRFKRIICKIWMDLYDFST